MIYLIGMIGMSSEAQTLLLPDKIARKRSFQVYNHKEMNIFKKISG